MITRSLVLSAAVLAALAVITPTGATAQRAHGGAPMSGGIHVGSAGGRIGYGGRRFHPRGYGWRHRRFYPGYYGDYGDYGDYSDNGDLSDGYASADDAPVAYPPPPQPTHPICPALIHWDTKTGRAVRTNYC